MGFRGGRRGGTAGEFVDWNPGTREESRAGTWSEGGGASQGGQKTTKQKKKHKRNILKFRIFNATNTIWFSLVRLNLYHALAKNDSVPNVDCGGFLWAVSMRNSCG